MGECVYCGRDTGDGHDEHEPCVEASVAGRKYPCPVPGCDGHDDLHELRAHAAELPPDDQLGLEDADPE